MNLNILTSGKISSRFGIRPALMFAARRDLSKHSVVRVVSEEGSGWIGIAYGHLITGAKFQSKHATKSGVEALVDLLATDHGEFDLIQLDNRLLGDELSQAIGISVDELLNKIKDSENGVQTSIADLIQNCKRVDDAIAVLMSTGGYEGARSELAAAANNAQNRILLPARLQEIAQESGQETKDAVNAAASMEGMKDGALQQPDDEDWNLDAETPSERLRLLHEQAKKQRKPGEDAGSNGDLNNGAGPEPSSEFSSALELSSSNEPSSFLLLTRQEEAFTSSALAPVDLPALPSLPGDRLGQELRAELHDFVRQQFGVDERKFFEDLDIEKSESYQASLVLRDLEQAIEKSRFDLGSSGSFRRLAESLETHAALSGQDAFVAWKKAKQEQADAAQTSAGAPAAGLKVSSAELEQSRRIFVEQVRKNTEVDTREYLASQVSDSELESKMLRENKLRQMTIAIASVCLIVSLSSFVFYLASRRSSLDEASQLMKAGRLPQAKAAYEKIINANPNNWEAYLGHALCSPDDLKAQAKDYKEVLRLRPNEYSAALSLARVHFDMKDYRWAEAAALKAWQINKDSVASLKIRADALMKMGKYTDAAKVLNQALSLKSNHEGELYYTLFCCYRELKDYDKQKVSLTKAQAFDPKNPLYIREHVSLIAKKLGPDKLKKELERAISLSPLDGSLRYDLARILIAESDTEKAIQQLTEAIEKGYANSQSLFERAKLYLAKGMYGYARVDLKEALSKDPNRADLKAALSRAEASIARVKKEVDAREAVHQVQQEEAVSLAELGADYLARAYAFMQEGKFSNAARLLKAGLRGNPNDLRARRYLASCFFHQGNYAEAASQFAYVESAQNLSAEEKYYFGKSLAKSNKLEKAIDVLQDLISSEPDNCKARVELIKAYLLAGFPDHARQECEEGMKQSRNQIEYAEIKSLMP